MANPHRIIDQIASFTSLRDLELLEFSLLNTINGMLKPQSLKLIKVDNRNRPIKEIEYVMGNCNVKFDDIQLQQELVKSIEYINTSETDSITSTLDDHFICVHLLLHTRAASAFLVVTSHQKTKKAEDYLLSGIYQVYRNFTQLLLDSQTDALTGLANRKTFDDSINKVYELILFEDDFPDDQREADPERQTYWLALIDIDHFKKVNDTFGHLFGDEVLVLFSNIMKQSFREHDMIFRFGGEEFVVVLKTPSLEACREALERLRKTVEETEFPGVGHITISIGAVQMSSQVFHVTLLEYADQALYYCKNHGRNQLQFFEQLVEMGEAEYETQEAGDIELF